MVDCQVPFKTEEFGHAGGVGQLVQERLDGYEFELPEPSEASHRLLLGL